MTKQHAPAAERNKEPILAVLQRVLPASGTVLEIASGTGQHASHFAAALPGITWQPTDADPLARQSIQAWVDDSGLENLRAPLELRTDVVPWPVERADGLVCINMVHISPWSATEGLFAGAARILADGAPVVLYGPYRIGGAHTAPSNAAFDEDLKARNPAWGVRDLEAVIELAGANGFAHRETVAMPANNQIAVFRKAT